MTRDVVRMAMMAVLVGCGGAAATPSAAGAGTPLASAPVVSAPVPRRFEPCPDPAGGGRWSVIRLTEFLPRDRSRADVEQTLLGRARLAIVERDLGISVSGVTSRIVGEEGVGGSSQLTDIFLQQFRQEVGGRVVEECARYADAGRDSLAIEFHAVVAKEAEAPSAGFAGEVTLSQPAYREGDKVTLKVTVTEPARVYLFAVARDGSATLFFPHPYDTLNVMRGGDTLALPRRGSPYELVTTLDPRFSAPQVEHVLALFYKGPGTAPFQPRDAFTRTFTNAEVNQALMRIPRSLRTQAASGYTIAKRAP
ncbi:MAG: hypothetical protein RL139_1087 [Gemmatimonadota bacterium]|jgi:Domain of unknown function (DUF4384)